MTKREKKDKLKDLEGQIQFLAEKYVNAPNFMSKVAIEMQMKLLKEMYLVTKAQETFEEDLNELANKALSE